MKTLGIYGACALVLASTFPLVAGIARADVIDDLLSALNEPGGAAAPVQVPDTASPETTSPLAAPRDDAAAIAELSATIETLKSRLAGIVAERLAEAQRATELAQHTESSSSGDGETHEDLILERTLGRGAHGDDVSSLQRYLITEGLLDADSATGFFGALTERAVQRWQSAHGIVASGDPASTGFGLVGKLTRAALMAAHHAGNDAEMESASQDTQSSADDYMYDDSSYDISWVDDEQWVTEEDLKEDEAGPEATQVAIASSADLSEEPASDDEAGVVATPQTPLSCQLDGTTVEPYTVVTAYQSRSVPIGQTCVSESRSCNGGVLTGSYPYASCASIPNTDPIGTFDAVAVDSKGVSYLAGWAFDPDASSTSLTMLLYKDGTRESGTKVSEGPTVANASAVNESYGISGLHRFRYNLPAGDVTGEYHMYAIDAQTNEPTELARSPRTITSGTDCVLDGVTVPNNFSRVFYSTASAVSPATCATSDRSRVCTNGTLSGDSAYQYASCVNSTTASASDTLAQMASVLQSILSLLGR